MKEFSEPLEEKTLTSKKTYNIYLLILLIIIIIGGATGIIILSIKLKNKSNDYNKLRDENDILKKDLNKTKQEYENIIKQYTSQNDTLNDIFNKYQDLILKANITNPNIYRENYTDVKSKVREMAGLEDGTYDFVTKEPIYLKEGYEVSFETYSRNSLNYYSDEDYDNIVYKLSALFGINAQLGVYENNAMISYYLEDKNMSLAIAALFNQRTVWDWSTNDTILNTFNQSKYY